MALANFDAMWATLAPREYRRTRREVFLILSRIQNSGYELGENNRTTPWYRTNHRTPWQAKSLTKTSFGLLG